MVVVGAPFVEMVGNVVSPRIGGCVFEIDDDVFVVFGRIGGGVFE